ncbi:hypothetical protein HJFPF1_02381 [Paramyrothecium foliicola]|nr:hypothetical protein HJFPF1_02381 [Paramyrothecium foliicola]
MTVATGTVGHLAVLQVLFGLHFREAAVAAVSLDVVAADCLAVTPAVGFLVAVALWTQRVRLQSIKPPGGFLPPGGSPQNCAKPSPVEKCTVVSRIYTPRGENTKTTSSTTVCGTVTACNLKDSTITKTISTSDETSTRTFTDFDVWPTNAPNAELQAIASSVEASMTLFGEWFNPPITNFPSVSATGLCSVAMVAGGGTAASAYTYCDCGESYGSTLPLRTQSEELCGYTELPPICRYGASPRQSREWCNCENFPRTLSVLPTSGNKCGYTSFPEPWPYTSTDSDGNVLACETSRVVDSKTSCDGDQYTATRAPPKPTEVPRCIVAHTNMDNCLLGGDFQALQIWENGVQVCRAAKSKFMASDRTVYEFDCGDGRSAKVFSNSNKVVYKAKDGWEGQLDKIDSAWEVYDCGYLEGNGGMKTIKGSRFEAVFGHGDCGNCAKPSLCDFVSVCKGFDGKCG